MLLGLAIVEAVIIVAALIGIAVTRSIWTESRLLNQTGIAIPDGQGPALVVRFRSSSIWVYAGAIVGSVITSIVAAIIAQNGTIETLSFPIAGVILGASLALCRWLMTESNRRARFAGAVERPGLRLNDYVSRPLLLAQVVGVAIGLAVLIGGGIAVTTLPTTPIEGFYLSPASPALPLFAAVIGWIAVLVTSAHVVRQRQSAASSVDLAWDDAITAHALVKSARLLSIALYYAIISLSSVATSFGWRSDIEFAVLLTPIGVGALIWIIAGIRDPKPERHFLRTLWPDTAAEADALVQTNKQAQRDALIANHAAKHGNSA